MSWNQLPPDTRKELTNRLSRRQHDVLILWLAGCSYNDISRMLRIQPRTVRTHLHAARITYNQITEEHEPHPAPLP